MEDRYELWEKYRLLQKAVEDNTGGACGEAIRFKADYLPLGDT